jgi:hypothetical protein
LPPFDVGVVKSAAQDSFDANAVCGTSYLSLRLSSNRIHPSMKKPPIRGRRRKGCRVSETQPPTLNSTPARADSEDLFLPDLADFYLEGSEEAAATEGQNAPPETAKVQQLGSLAPYSIEAGSSESRERDGSTASYAGDNFFERNIGEPAEIIEGILREGQLAAFGGPFGMGKTPVLIDLIVCIIHGLNWCGRRVERRPVIVIDCETPGADYKKAVKAISERHGLPLPRVRENLLIYLERDHPSEPDTEHLMQVVSENKQQPKIEFVGELLEIQPHAVVIIDPLEMFFRLDTSKKADVMSLYRPLRILMGKFPHAAMINTFNLRKMDRKGGRSDLLSDPRGWLEEVCGSLDLLNRSDVRLGIDSRGDDIRVLNGIVRGKEMHPVLIRPFVDTQERLAGFEQVPAGDLDLLSAFTDRQKAHWDKLPKEFKFEEVADQTVPRSTLSRLIKRTLSLGALTKTHEGVFRKTGTR